MVRSLRLRRRSLLKALGAGALVSAGGPAIAIGDRSKVGIGQLRHGGRWDHRPEALRRVLWETGRRTSIDVARDANAVSLGDDDLFSHPLLALTGEGDMPAWQEPERARLLRHLRFGGLLWIDVPRADDPFGAAVERELAAIAPRSPMTRLEPDHVLFKSYYLLAGAKGRLDEDSRVYGVDVGGRTACIITRSDVLGAHERDRFGGWTYDCSPGGERQREEALRFGVNVMMYATCTDYKTDQVHIPFIMKKRRR